MLHESWIPIPGFEGYQASTLGRIRSVDRDQQYRKRMSRTWTVPVTRTLRGKIIVQHRGLYGHMSVTIAGSNRMVDSLILRAFLGPPLHPDLRPLHRNGNPSDCRLANLRWGQQLTLKRKANR